MGYYTNATDYHIFTDEEDYNNWIENTQDNIYSVPPYGYTNEVDTFIGIDTDGNAETVYNIGMGINENDDGTVEVTVGVSNDKNEFGYVSTITYEDTNSGDTANDDTTQDDTNNDDTTQNNSTNDGGASNGGATNDDTSNNDPSDPT